MAQITVKTPAPSAMTALRNQINQVHHVARQKLTEDGYAGAELERLATRMTEAYLRGGQDRQWREAQR